MSIESSAVIVVVICVCVYVLSAVDGGHSCSLCPTL